jgi:hypothetical protein
MVFVPGIATFAEQSKIISYLDEKILPSFKYNVQKSRFIEKCSNFCYENGHLYFKKGQTLLKMVCEEDKAATLAILHSLHSENHHGEKKMRYSLNQEYSGIKISALREYLANCEECKHYQALKNTDVIRNITASKSFERLQIDLVDLRRFSEVNDEFQWMLNVLDVFSKYSFSYRLKTKSAEEVIIYSFYLYVYVGFFCFGGFI